jgi:murein DD-endopeptidase MepM/ murein hydrolase activator NlpD
MFWPRLCRVCILLVSCGCLASSQQKTERGFYFPVDLKSSDGHGIRKGPRGFLSGCTADSNDFHPGVDLLAKVETPVYAVSGGVVTARSGQGLSPGVVALLVRHKPRPGAEFYAVYGNIRTTLEAGMSVVAGQSIGVVGNSASPLHLHFAVIVTVADIPPAPDDWDLLPCSRWPDRVRYTDPLGWLGPLKVGNDSALNRCDLNGDGVVDAKDMELAIQMALKVIPCTADLNGDGECNVIDVQRIVNASLTSVCRVGP